MLNDEFWGSADLSRTSAHFLTITLPRNVQVNTIHAPAAWIENFSDRVEPPEIKKKTCE
jgi:hypothetical protein